MRRLTIRLHGIVQGVGFRAFAVREGRRLGLAGCARNLPDGSVLVEAEGSEEKLRELERRLRSGPPAAWVQRAAAEWGPAAGDFTGFNVGY